MDAQEINHDLNVRLWDRIPVRLGLGLLIITLAALALTLLIVARQEERHFTEAHLDDAHKIAAVTATDLGEQMMAGATRQSGVPSPSKRCSAVR